MFTIKLKDGYKTRILEAESFTILYQSSGGTEQQSRHWAEVTLHNRGEGVRYDVGDSPMRDGSGDIAVYQQAYIENAQGRTVERIDFGPVNLRPRSEPPLVDIHKDR